MNIKKNMVRQSLKEAFQKQFINKSKQIFLHVCMNVLEFLYYSYDLIYKNLIAILVAANFDAF